MRDVLVAADQSAVQSLKKQGSEWKDVPEYKKEVFSRGKKYRLIKQEREFPIYERIGRIALGTLLTVLSFGYALNPDGYVRRLFTKSEETFRIGVAVDVLPSLKTEIALRAIRGESVESLAKKYSVSEQEIQSWKQKTEKYIQNNANQIFA